MYKGLLALVVFSAVLWAQSDTASLSGTITDPSGSGVVGAEITLRNISTGSRRVGLTDIQGSYHFSLLVPGQYEITANAKGFVEHHDTELSLQVAQAARLDVQLRVGSTTERVEVVMGVSPLNTENVSQGTVIGTEKIESLPLNGRQFLQLALLVPGANPGGRAVQQNQFRQGMMAGLSISGGRTNNTNFLLDGAPNID